ncbi:hypothetical protein DDE18_03820 [Nocardioides gansuensis]|uniref:Phage shock protein PspC N-terminal domain-containing protein n=1 Tax=Nocardioides gansuensis TaxID=2138300 RepID=A0A2T8FGA2_9ACTN|nr:PspC domain-containing protein [Nocardioides gansuensis]PVG84736.1 hypothetical protein DDE18_03820 [Nocardioides gansuensis]
MNTAPPPPSPDQSTEPPSGPPPATGPRVTREQVFDLGRLRRSRDDVRIAGVASGLARHLDVDPILVRVLLVVLAFFGGAGVIIYLACWLLVPEEGTGDRPLGLDDRNRSIALGAVGVLALLALVGEWAGGGHFWFPWPILLVALVVLFFVRRGERRAVPPAGPPAAGAGDPAYGMDPAYPAGAAYAPRPPNPRKRGPILFWPVLAIIALAVGTLGVVDLAGVGVPDSAYPATALGVIAAALLVGAFWGRAGGLILLGLVAAFATTAATVPSHWEGETINERPVSTGEVRDSYSMDAGHLVLDLSAVNDVAELDGHRIHVDGGAGTIEVVVPDDMDVSVDATVGGPGDVSMFGAHSSGFSAHRSGSAEGGDEAPDMTIEIDLGIGEIIVTEK